MDALDEILSFVNRFPDAEDEAIDLLLDQLEHESSLKSSIIDKESVNRVTSVLLQAEAAAEGDSGSASNHSAIRVIDAFLVPKFRYDSIKKHFYQHAGSLPIHGEASAKAALYRDRFLLLFQRVSRDQHFSRPSFDVVNSEFGSCEITTGFFTENTIVVAEGEMLVDGIFQVITCGFPPLEDRDQSLKLLAGYDFFGGGTLKKEDTLRLADLEKRAANDMFVILSDIWLDNEEVMGKLEVVLDGFESVEVVPSLFVFMGNFCSHPCNLSFHSFSSLRLQFGKLGQMIAAHPRLKEHSRFLFIPGPDDAGPSTVLPRCALPKYLTEELQKYIPNAIFSSNPCRLNFLITVQLNH
ncbi:DNA polymerase epsilon subunit B [Citrus sinensis]|uniref:DNA polymerase epsilon subunit B n=1 Tax=Citrus sinensis TaxID=2711 RepID=A0ACB8M5P1_CITSI|nr:DNA polymerase epsilon subunit B [Citrus sinensis]